MELAALSVARTNRAAAGDGERIWNLERLFNLAAGFTAADDKLPKRLLSEAAKTGRASNRPSSRKRMGEVTGMRVRELPFIRTLSRE